MTGVGRADREGASRGWNRVDAGAIHQYYHMWGGGNESGTSWNPLGDIIQSSVWYSVMDDKLPPTLGPLQTVKYPIPFEQVDT